MQLNTRQARIFTLAILLGTGKPVSAADIITSLDCSEPTLTRALKELRESYSAEIKYSKAGHSYQLVNPGQLDKKTLRRMSEALASNAVLKTSETGGRVYLDKDKKTAVSLSLRMRILRKIDRLAMLSGTSRSEAVEKLAERAVDELIKEFNANKVLR
ncbi:tellurium resistance protein TerW [Enterobacteriaceae bacterium H4N4]|uniref:Tellurium resistance protein TerW n=1 Tax=Silvania confinis TaxID=2926470 RepID=A0A9J6QEP5_9ENTR|nr:tellurium resistance protein TerW [Silvania confinis]MCU6667826.1 tellurium resistance protein TerW [Silvania confinis]